MLLMLNPRSFLLEATRTILLNGISIFVAVTSVVAQASNTPAANASAGRDATVRAHLAFDVVSMRPSNDGPDQWHLQVVPGGDQYEAIVCRLA